MERQHLPAPGGTSRDPVTSGRNLVLREDVFSHPHAARRPLRPDTVGPTPTWGPSPGAGGPAAPRQTRPPSGGRPSRRQSPQSPHGHGALRGPVRSAPRGALRVPALRPPRPSAPSRTWPARLTRQRPSEFRPLAGSDTTRLHTVPHEPSPPV